MRDSDLNEAPKESSLSPSRDFIRHRSEDMSDHQEQGEPSRRQDMESHVLQSQETSHHEPSQQRLERNTRLLRTVSAPHGDAQTQAHPDLSREEAGTGQLYPSSREGLPSFSEEELTWLRKAFVQTNQHAEEALPREQEPASITNLQDPSSSAFLYLEEAGTGQPYSPSLEVPRENLHDGEFLSRSWYSSQISSDIFLPTDEVLSLYAKETLAREQEPANRQDQSSPASDNREARQEEEQRDLPSREIHQLLTPQEISLLQGTSTYPVRRENGEILECRVVEGDPVYSLYAFIDREDPKLYFTSDPHDKRYTRNSERYVPIHTHPTLELLPKQEAAAYFKDKKQSIREALINQHDTPSGVDRGADTHASSVASNRQTISGHQVPHERVLNPESATSSRLSNREEDRPYRLRTHLKSVHGRKLHRADLFEQAPRKGLGEEKKKITSGERNPEQTERRGQKRKMKSLSEMFDNREARQELEAASSLQNKSQSLQETLINQPLHQLDTPSEVDRGTDSHASSAEFDRQTISDYQISDESISDPESATSSRLSSRKEDRSPSPHNDKTTEELAHQILQKYLSKSKQRFSRDQYPRDREQLEELKDYFRDYFQNNKVNERIKKRIRRFLKLIGENFNAEDKGTTLGKLNYKGLERKAKKLRTTAGKLRYKSLERQAKKLGIVPGGIMWKRLGNQAKNLGTTPGKLVYEKRKRKAKKMGTTVWSLVKEQKRKREGKLGVSHEATQKKMRGETGQSRDQTRAIQQGQSSQRDDRHRNWPDHLVEPPLPDTLNGRRVRLHDVPGDGMNCLIYALLHAGGRPTRQRGVPLEQATRRQLRTENIVEQTREFLRTNDAVQDNTMLRADSIYEIGSVVGYLRSQGHLHQDRGIIIHRYRYNSMTNQPVLEANTILESSNQAPPIELFLRETEQHFYSIQELDR